MCPERRPWVTPWGRVGGNSWTPGWQIFSLLYCTYPSKFQQKWHDVSQASLDRLWNRVDKSHPWLALQTFTSGFIWSHWKHLKGTSLNLRQLSGHSVLSVQANNTPRKWFIPFSEKWDEFPSNTSPCTGALGRFSPTCSITHTRAMLVATEVSALIFFIKASSYESRKSQ